MNTKLYPMRHEEFLRQGLHDLLNWTSERLSAKGLRLDMCQGLEIGSYAGESAAIFAPRLCTLTCIDPWLNGYDENDVASSFAPFSEVEKAFDDVQQRHRNVVKIKKTSDEAWSYLRTFSSKRMFNFVYIDGMHTYEQVKKDIKGCMEFLIDGPCVIAGHDYHSENWPQVVQAIHETIGTPDATFSDTSWAKFHIA